ncbi:MAG: hypothetical protein IJK54_08195 [Clostridia bacterium]|nr:hypothetical protein [Clostridia bacterium]
MKEKEFYRSVLKQTLMNKTEAKERIDAQTGFAPSVERKRVHLSRRAVIAIVVAASLLIVGSAAAATAQFVRQNYTPNQYLFQNAEQRQSNGETISDVEQTLSAARPTDVSYTIRMMPEIDQDGIIAGWREYMGQPPYKEEDWAWVRELKPTIGDVLYDGKELYVTTYVDTDRPEVFDLNAETPQSLWIACEGAEYRLSGDDTVYTAPMWGENWGYELGDRFVTVYSQCEMSDLPFPEEGVVTMTQRLYVADGLADSMQPERAAIAIIDFTFTFDASAGRSVAKDAHVSIPLSGEYIVSMEEWARYDTYEEVIHNNIIQNKPLNVDGVTLDAMIEYRPVGIYVTLTIKDAPDTWTLYEKVSLISAISSMINDGPDLPYRINGEEPHKPEGMNYGSSDAIYVLLPVYPSEYDSVSSLTLDLLMHRIVSVNGEEPRDDWSWDFEKQGGFGNIVYASEPLATIEIPIPKIR